MRRISHARGLCAALEEEQVVEAAVAEQAVANGDAAPAVDPVEQLDNAESLETELLEVQETVEEGAVQEGQVEEAVEVSEALDEYQEALESIAGSGGLDRNGAMILQIGLEQLCARVGIEPSKISMPSMESFGGTTSRVKATSLALESVKETAANVWKAIVEAIKRAGEWLKNFWKTLTDSNHRLKARAEKVKAAAASATGDASGEIENGSLANKLHVNGKVEKGFATDFGVFAGVVGTMAGKVVPGVVNYSKEVVGDNQKGVMNGNYDDFSFKAASVKAAYSGLKLSAAEGEAAEGLETLKSEQLPGGKAVIVQIPTADGVDGMQQLARAKTAIGLFKPATAKATSDKLPVMAGGEVANVAGMVLQVSAHVDTLRGLEKEFDAFVKQLLTAASNFNNLGGKEAMKEGADVGKAKAAMAKARAVLSSMVTRISNLPAAVGGYALSTSKSALDYCELSLKGGKAAAAK